MNGICKENSKYNQALFVFIYCTHLSRFLSVDSTIVIKKKVGQEVLHVKPENIVVVDKAQSAPVVAYPVSTNAAAFDTCAGQRQGAHRLKGQRGASVM